jgi:hypothetical protein
MVPAGAAPDQLELGCLFDRDVGDLAATQEFDDLLGRYLG